MALRFIPYTPADADADADTERWAVWSTVVDDWLVFGLDADGVEDWYADRKAREAARHAWNAITEIRKRGPDSVYRGGLPSAHAMATLERGDVETPERATRGSGEDN